MTRHHEQPEQYLPDFLSDSPFLPVSNTEDSYSSHRARGPPPRPTFRLLLRPKRIRSILTFLSAFVLLLYLRSYFLKHGVLLSKLKLSSIPTCLYTEPVTPGILQEEMGGWGKGTKWGEFAYVQYVTNLEYLCNAVMGFERLEGLGSRARRVLLFPDEWDGDDGEGDDGDGVEAEGEKRAQRRLLGKAKEEYGVNLVPVEVLTKSLSYKFWASSYTKLLAFNLTQYNRLLLLDSDSTILRPMDELFLLPPSTATLPLAYWLEKPILSSHIMLITPSEVQFQRVRKEIEKAGLGTYDMEIVNRLFGGSCSVLPHRGYALLSGEFREKEHGKYLTPWALGAVGGKGKGKEEGEGEEEEWDPEKEIKEAKFVHFSDYPLPKPWEVVSAQEVEKWGPKCWVDGEGREDCRDKRVWEDLYGDFRERRKRVCGV